jgi:hypothetical protein
MGGKVCAHIYRLFQNQYYYFPIYPVLRLRSVTILRLPSVTILRLPSVTVLRLRSVTVLRLRSVTSVLRLRSATGYPNSDKSSNCPFTPEQILNIDYFPDV